MNLSLTGGWESKLNLGDFAKRTVLTGAGWTRNWGGWLANELWGVLLGDSQIQRSPKLRQLLLDETSFEVALAKTWRSPFDERDRQIFQKALQRTFVEMDEEIRKVNNDINIYGVQDLLASFCGRYREGFNTGYIFTLNQDLWLERRLYNGFLGERPSPVLPGIVTPRDRRFFETDLGEWTTLRTKVADQLGDVPTLQGHCNVIKLHGSFTWETMNGEGTMVLGTEKGAQIKEIPLLQWYAEIFKRILAAGDMRLMIAGYGFGDEHINATIADAVMKHGLRVFIWNTSPDIRSLVCSAPHGTEIWSGLLGVSSRQLIEVFPGTQEETAQYRRIRNAFHS